MQPKILIAGCELDHLDSVTKDLSSLDVHTTTSPNQIRSTIAQLGPDVLIVSAGVPDPMRQSIESLVHEREPSFAVHWQPDTGRGSELAETVRAVAERWLESNAHY